MIIIYKMTIIYGPKFLGRFSHLNSIWRKKGAKKVFISLSDLINLFERTKITLRRVTTSIRLLTHQVKTHITTCMATTPSTAITMNGDLETLANSDTITNGKKDRTGYSNISVIGVKIMIKRVTTRITMTVIMRTTTNKDMVRDIWTS